MMKHLFKDHPFITHAKFSEELTFLTWIELNFFILS